MKIWVVALSYVQQNDMEPGSRVCVCATQELAIAAKRRLMLLDWEQSIRDEPCFIVEVDRYGNKRICLESSETELYGDPPEDLHEIEAIWKQWSSWHEETNADICIYEDEILTTVEAIEKEMPFVERSKIEEFVEA